MFLEDAYVKCRKKSTSSIPLTVRQLESLIRISESIAKCSLCRIVTLSHAQHAMRLFEESTLKTLLEGSITGSDNSAPEVLIPIIKQVEDAVKRRVQVGTSISVNRITEELTARFVNLRAVQWAIHNMMKRGELESGQNRKMITRKR